MKESLIWKKALVLNNLSNVLKSLEFENPNCLDYIWKEIEILDIWEDEWTKYATIELCCEIPLECLEIK